MKLIIFLSLIATAMADTKALLKQSSNQFTTDMFQEVIKVNPDKSVILSAFSVLPPLAQLSLASVDGTHDEILKAIGMPNDNVTKEVFTDVSKSLTSVEGVDLKIASRIYVANNAELNPSFEAVSRAVFNSDVKNVKFDENIKTAAEINGWVEDQTNKRIKDLVDPKSLDYTTRAVLVNAIYFKGKWKYPFQEMLTAPGAFYKNNGEKIDVPTMHKTESYLYGESAELDAKLLELPYSNEDITFLIVLPNKKDGLPKLVDTLKDSSVLINAVDKMYSAEVIVSLPKFKIETTTNLKEILHKMDIKKLFTPEAKLSNLLKNEADLFISDAIQKAFIEVNEEGAEAAAANAMIVDSSLMRWRQLFFKVDRPFYFQIKSDGLSLFEGALLEPQ